MGCKQRKTREIGRVEQLQALSSPLRHRILAALETNGPSSVRDLAVKIEAAPESLYYHLERLLAVELVVVSGTQPTARRPAKLYDLASRDWEVRLKGASDAYIDAYAEMGRALLRWTERSHRVALFDSSVIQSGPRRERSLAQFHTRLDPRGLEKANRLLGDLESLLVEHEVADGDPFVFTFVVAPIPAGSDST